MALLSYSQAKCCGEGGTERSIEESAYLKCLFYWTSLRIIALLFDKFLE